MVLRWFLFLLFLGVLGTTYADDLYVAAPNTLRLNADETIAVATDGRNIAVVSVFVQDFPGKVKNITHTELAVVPGHPEIFKVRLNPSDFPPNILNVPGSPMYVSLNVHCDTFRKEIVIPVSTESGYVFVQMDKPIYTPKQTARMRIIPLNEESLPYDEVFKLEIRNPNGSIVEEKVFGLKNQETRKTFATHSYKFPRYPVLGEWSATVLYGFQFQQKNTVRFELQEYVLPTFTVEIKTPDVILPSAETITVKVLSKYVYGKNVRGNVTFRLGVQSRPELKTEPVFFAATEPKELVDGAFEFSFKTDNIKVHTNIGWFPAIKESHLFVEATVMEVATGKKEIAVNSKGRFNTSPFIISFKRCLRDFKPGHVSVFQADIYYFDGTPAVGIPVNIEALANHEPLNILQNTAVTDEDGKVAFEIQPELHHSIVKVIVETNDPRHVGSQAIGKFIQGKFESSSNAYIALARSIGQRLQPGDIFKKMIHFEPEEISNIYYLVLARGKILEMNKLPIGQFKTRSVEFEITHEMVPSFRILVFAHFRNELLADSLKIEVERVCHKDSKVSVTPEYSVKEPGSPGKFIIKGTKGTLVGLLGIDEAVYALSKKDLLTKSKVFKKFETHDLGCGPGGGRDIDSILGFAGIIIMTNKYSPSTAHACIRINRRKRHNYLRPVPSSEIPLLSASGTLYSGIDYTCCILGRSDDKYSRNCHERTNIVIRMLKGQYENCSRAFLDCCISATEEKHSIATQYESFDVSSITLDEFMDPDFIVPEEEEFFEGDLTVRSDFKETWIFEDILIGEHSTEQLDAILPHSITTWVVQAVSVSPTHGICVAEPQKLVSFKKIFLQLNLPYSVVRNERVEIQATVFNYGYKQVSAVIFMYGAEDLCTGVRPGEKSERKRLRVNKESGISVSFPVIPLKAGDITIKVVVLTPEGSDAIEKQLHVVYEGVPKEINIPIKLDPTNQQRRVRRRVISELYSDAIDPDKNLQVTSIKLSAPEGFVPGTASCSITALGDQYGTVIQTSVNNPDGLLQKPRGCGEQNMMYLAPTLYTVKYLKVTGKLTAAMEEKGYSFIRTGYVNQLIYRKEDGSYAAFPRRPTSGWLTAFVMKVLCQANQLVHIDDDVLCSGVRWLINNQEPDGSYIERNPLYDVDLMGGVEGKTPMTAFTLIALEECKCDEENLLLAKKKALTYLEKHLEEQTKDVNTPLRAAIVAYALALSNSEWKQAANEKLLSMITTDEGTNTMYWITPNAAQDIQTAGYGLLTQLLFNDLSRSNAIVNWLNTKQLQSGCFKSTQDTVIALQALAEYAIKAQTPPINLVANISSSNDKNFHHVLTFNEDNALMLQDVQLDEIGGTLFINTSGHGIGSLAVKLRYNLIVPPEEICKFHVEVNVSEGKTEKKEPVDQDSVTDSQEEEMLDENPDVVVKAIKMALDDVPILKIEPRNITKRNSPVPMPLKLRDIDTLRIKRENLDQESSKLTLKISLCVRYLANTDAGMSIVDVGIVSGFEPVLGDLQTLQDDPYHLIQRYEKSKRGVVFYLQKVPTEQNYCFSFRIVQKYLVGNAQTSVIKVYDYYNPDAACTMFYSPSNHSSVLHICEGGVCECAEDVCPPKNPFSSIYASSDVEERRQKLKEVVCEKYDYVWKGKLKEEVKKEGGFLNISFTIDEVIKEGTEKRYDVQGKSRTLLVRDNCDKTCPILLGTMYLILGRDGQKYENNVGDTWYRYMLDKNSVVHTWTEIPESKNKELQRDLNYVTAKLLKGGCKL